MSLQRINGFEIIITDRLPRQLVGHHITPLYPHPLVRTLRGLFGVPDWPIRFLLSGRIEHTDILRMGNQIIMSPAHYDALYEESRGK